MLIAREQSVLQFETSIARKNVAVDSQLAALRRSSVSYLFTIYTKYWKESRIFINTISFAPISIKCHEVSFVVVRLGSILKKGGGEMFLHFCSSFKFQKACKDCTAGNVSTRIMYIWNVKYAFTFPYGVTRGSFASNVFHVLCCKYVFQLE